MCDFVANLWWPHLATDIVHMSDRNRHREVDHSGALLQQHPSMKPRRAIQEAKNMGTRRFEREFHRFRSQCREHCRAGTFFDADAVTALERHEGPPMEQVLAVVTADSSLRSERPMACPQPKSMPRQSDVERAETEAVNTTGTRLNRRFRREGSTLGLGLVCSFRMASLARSCDGCLGDSVGASRSYTTGRS